MCHGSSRALTRGNPCAATLWRGCQGRQGIFRSKASGEMEARFNRAIHRVHKTFLYTLTTLTILTDIENTYQLLCQSWTFAGGSTLPALTHHPSSGAIDRAGGTRRGPDGGVPITDVVTARAIGLIAIRPGSATPV